MFGEIYGTNEVPALVSAVARELAEEGERILVALEILDLLNGDLAEFVAGKTEVDEFLAGELFWSRDLQDGRSSHAMLQLMQDIRGYRHRGLVVEPRGFDSVVRSPRDRDVLMALNLRAMIAHRPYDRVLILTGNYHARRRARFLGMRRRSMASCFDRSELLSITVRFLGGSAWHCRTRDGCGVFGLPDRSYAQPLNRVNLFSPHARQAEGFDGEIVLARATPSPPACEPSPPGGTAGRAAGGCTGREVSA